MRFALVLAETFSGLRRNVSMVVSVILVTFISLTFVGTAILMQMQIGQMKDYWHDKAQVVVYLCTAEDTNCDGHAATDDDVAEVKRELTSGTLGEYVQDASFVSQEQAYKDFKKQFEGSEIADLVTPDQFNESFWVKLKNSDDSRVIVEGLTGVAGVQSVVDQRSYLDDVFSVLNVASFTAIGIAVLMLVAAVLLISTTIRLSAMSRRRELGIMRLVGASNGFIQLPFILEGVISAFIGAALAGGATVAIVHYFVHGYVSRLIHLEHFVSVSDALLVAPALALIGIVLAGIASSFAITRYLRV